MNRLPLWRLFCVHLMLYGAADSSRQGGVYVSLDTDERGMRKITVGAPPEHAASGAFVQAMSDFEFVADRYTIDLQRGSR